MAQNDKLTVGLIGCGRMGAKTPERVRQSVPKGWLPLSHAEAIKSITELELIAVCDTDPERLSWAAQTYSVANSYEDYKSLILEAKPDIVSIATRTNERCDIIRFAAENGVKGIHAEKPISCNMADCRRALEAVSANDVKFSYGTYRRYMDIYRRAKELVRAGEIGELLEICIEHGKTMLLWNHPHSVDLILYYSECLDVDFLQAFCQVNDPAHNSSIVDDDPVVEYGFIKFTNGVNGIISSASGLNTRLAGTEGTLTIIADGSWLEMRKKDSDQTPYHLSVDKIPVDSESSGTQRAFLELISAISGNEKQLSITTDEILVSQRILLSLVVSSIKGSRKIDPLQIEESFTVTGKFGSHYA